MVITSLLAAVVLGQEKLTAGSLISKSFAKYAAAKQLSAKVTWTQTAAGAKVETVTELQYERPDKFYLRQQRGSKDPQSCLITSDGMMMSYDRPKAAIDFGDRVQEPLDHTTFDGKVVHTQLPDIYKAAILCMVDHSLPMDILVAHPSYLKDFKTRLLRLELGDKVQVRGIDGYNLKGQLKPLGMVGGADFEMVLSADGDLLRYVEKFSMGGGKASEAPVTVVSVWDVDAKVDGKLDRNLFRVVR